MNTVIPQQFADTNGSHNSKEEFVHNPRFSKIGRTLLLAASSFFFSFGASVAVPATEASALIESDTPISQDSAVPPNCGNVLLKAIYSRDLRVIEANLANKELLDMRCRDAGTTPLIAATVVGLEEVAMRIVGA